MSRYFIVLKLFYLTRGTFIFDAAAVDGKALREADSGPSVEHVLCVSLYRTLPVVKFLVQEMRWFLVSHTSVIF